MVQLTDAQKRFRGCWKYLHFGKMAPRHLTDRFRTSGPPPDQFPQTKISGLCMMCSLKIAGDNSDAALWQLFGAIQSLSHSRCLQSGSHIGLDQVNQHN